MDTRLDDRYGFTDDPTIGLLEATALARAPGADTHSLL